jgi:hypothetical protein
MAPNDKSRLYQLYFPTYHRCHTCLLPKVASTIQILSDRLVNRQRYFCPDCATAKGWPPSKELLSRLPQAQETQATVKAAPGQKQRKKKAVAGDRSK